MAQTHGPVTLTRLLVKTGITLGCVIASSIFGPVSAQSLPLFEKTWLFYQEKCGLALRNPEAYLKSVKIPGPDGGRVVSSTPDGKIVQVLTGRDTAQEFYIVAAVGQRRIHYCSVTDYDESASVNSEQLALAMQDLLASNPQMVGVGGFMPHDLYFGDDGRSDGVTSIADAYQYFIDGGIENSPALTEVSFAQQEIQISGHLTETALSANTGVSP